MEQLIGRMDRWLVANRPAVEFASMEAWLKALVTSMEDGTLELA